MGYTAAHWGAYKIDCQKGLLPLEDDSAPSRIGRGWLSAALDRESRILAPAARRGWLDGDGGSNRCGDRFVEISWDEAARLAASEMDRVRKTHGNKAIYGGSYGWASAGRFHHAQSQLRRFLNLAGGFTSSRDTYSHAAAEVLLPHLTGMTIRAFQDQTTTLDQVAERCDLLLAFGGLSERTAQIASSGTTRHEMGGWIQAMRQRGARIVCVSPMRSDMPNTEWISVRPGSDTALLLSLSHEILAAGWADEDFMRRCTSGWHEFRAYLLGESDGVPKSADWAAPLCDVPADDIRALARDLASSRCMVAMAWGLQRADRGEQPLWAALALACILGQVGQPGTGFSFGYGSTDPVGRPCRIIPWPSFPQGRNPVDEYIPVARLTDMLLHPGNAYRYNGETRVYPDIRLVYWAGGNPFHHHQDLNRLERAWTRPETVIVHDHAWTSTARRADLVLPATTPLERADLMMNRRDTTLLFMSPAFDPIGEALDDHEIFRRIAGRLGFEESFTEGLDVDGWLRQLWAGAQAVAQREGFALPDYDTFREAGRFDVPDANESRTSFGAFVQDPDSAPLATESGRLVVGSDRIAGFDLDDCPGHPSWMSPRSWLLEAEDDELHLISGQPDTRLHAQNDRGDVSLEDKVQGREPLRLHPETAMSRGLQEGDVVRLWNRHGACLAGLRIDTDLRPDCAALATGAWYDPQEVDGQPLEVHGNPNVLTADIGCSGLSQGCAAHTALVRVEKWTGPLPSLTIDRPPPIDVGEAE